MKINITIVQLWKKNWYREISSNSPFMAMNWFFGMASCHLENLFFIFWQNIFWASKLWCAQNRYNTVTISQKYPLFWLLQEILTDKRFTLKSLSTASTASCFGILPLYNQHYGCNDLFKAMSVFNLQLADSEYRCNWNRLKTSLNVG